MTNIHSYTGTTPVPPPRTTRVRNFKLGLLRLCRGLGLFILARRLTRNRLRILCYHGISLDDEHGYEPILFMQAATFRRRMDILKRLRIRVISLDAAVNLLAANSIRNGELVLTIDDGWKSTQTIAAPVLREHGFPACLYVTTFYVDRRLDVFNVVMWYMLWRTEKKAVTLIGPHPQLDGSYDLSAERRAVGRRWILTVETLVPSAKRYELLRRFAAALGLDITEVLKGDRFKLMNADDLAKLVREFDIDIELHTHRHALPRDSAESVLREIDDNRRLLEAWTGKPCVHFCYPSGDYVSEHPAWLSAAGLKSATTCDEGLNDSRTPPMLLKRYLDRETWDDVEFEAAVSGFTELARRTRSAARR